MMRKRDCLEKEGLGRQTPLTKVLHSAPHLPPSNKSYHDPFLLPAPKQCSWLPLQQIMVFPPTSVIFHPSLNSFPQFYIPLPDTNCYSGSLPAIPGASVSQPSVTSPTSTSPPQKGPGTTTPW